MHDVRQAVRFFLRRPVVAAFAVVTLGVGLAAALAAFAIVDRVVLRDPAFPDPERLVIVEETHRDDPAAAKHVSPADFFDLRDSGAFASAAVWMQWNFNVTVAGTPRRLRGALVSPEFFTTLGRSAQRGSAREVVISHALWQNTFGADPSIAGRSLIMDGDPVTISGVMPADFAFPSADIEIWTPLVWGVHFEREDRDGRNLRMVARLKDGVALPQAEAIVRTVMRSVAATSPATHEGFSARVVSLRESLTHELRPMLLVLFGAAGSMLLIACANAMNLLLMLGASRRRELATRLALGARRARLARQAVSEGLVLGGAAGAVALALAATALRLTAALHLPLPEVALDARAIVAGVAAALLAGVIATTLPTILFSRFTAADSLRLSHQVLAPGGVLRNAFVIAQIALTCALLVCAGALVKSFDRLMSVDAGFETERILTARMHLGSRYDTTAKQIAFFQQTIERVMRLPGVTRAGTIQDLPLNGNAMTFDVTIDEARETKAAYRVVSDGYFGTMGIPILRGRTFTPFDDASAPPVFVINRAMASHAFRNADPIGRRLRISDGAWGTVVGIAGDVRHMGLDAEEIAAVYQPLQQKPHDWLRWTTLVLRTDGVAPATLGRALAGEVMALDPEQPVFDVIPMSDLLARRVARPRALAWVVSSLSAVALLIALIGTAAILSYAVTLRMRELAIRIALGADAAKLVRRVLGHSAILVLPGIALGAALAAAASPLLGRLLFRVPALDASTYGAVSLAMLAAAMLAALIPARRAARIDPALTLRAE